MRSGCTGPRFVDRLAVGARRQRDVVRVLVAAFDLERGDADVHDLRNLMEGERSPGESR